MRNSDSLPLDGHLLEQMANTTQNPRYHAEGSVLAHTELVVQKYFELRDRFELTAEEQEALYWAAVLHDIGKTVTTRFENERWTSPGHEKAGLPMARNILFRQPGITAAQRRKILDLVRWHGFPLWWSLKKRPLDDLKVLGTRTDLRLLSIFSIFDFEGRICENRDSVMDQIRHFHEVDVPRAEYEFGRYADLQARYETWNIRHKNALWNAMKLNNVALLEKLIEADPIESPPTYGKKAILTVGPPLAGKSTYLGKELADVFRIDLAEHGMSPEVIENQFYLDRRLPEFKHFLTVYLNRHRTVVLEGRNLDAKLRKRIVEMIRDLGVEVEYLVFDAPLDELISRNQQLAEPLPEEKIRADFAAFGLVHPWEAHRVEFV